MVEAPGHGRTVSVTVPVSVSVAVAVRIAHIAHIVRIDDSASDAEFAADAEPAADANADADAAGTDADPEANQDLRPKASTPFEDVRGRPSPAARKAAMRSRTRFGRGVTASHSRGRSRPGASRIAAAAGSFSCVDEKVAG